MAKRDLRNEDDVGPAGEPAVEGDPPGVPAHDFDDHDALVAAGGGVETVEGIGHAGHGAVEAEGHGGGFEIVVDGLRDADDRDAGFVELLRGGERAVAADADEHVDPQRGEGALGLLEDGGRDVAAVAAVADFGDEVAFARGAEHGAAEVHDPGGVGAGQSHRVAAFGEEALEAVVKADDFPVEIGGGADHAAEDGIEAGAIAAASEDADAFHRCGDEVWCLAPNLPLPPLAEGK